MQKKLAKIKYFPNNFQIIETGDHVICAISGKQIDITSTLMSESSSHISIEQSSPKSFGIVFSVVFLIVSLTVWGAVELTFAYTSSSPLVTS